MSLKALPADPPRLGLVCPAGSLPALKAAVDDGANRVYVGLRDAAKARDFAGLNFDETAIRSGIAYAHAHACMVFTALNTCPQAVNPAPWRAAMDQAVALAVDAVRRGALDGAVAQARLLPLMPEQPCNGYWHGHPGLEQVTTVAAQPQTQECGHGAW